jgi:hypothetical protein
VPFASRKRAARLDRTQRLAWKNPSGSALFEDRRNVDSSREGMLEGFSLGSQSGNPVSIVCLSE